METIKNYLESMFASMPNTPEVRKAKAELLQMMEDKYNELISEGTSENAAVGTVISEFGNLDELAESLGLTKEVEVARGMETEMPRRFISLDEVKSYISNRNIKALFRALGILLCIISVSFVIILGPKGTEIFSGIGLMIISIALGVGFLVYSGFADHEWKFIGYESCSIDMNTAAYVKEKKRSFEPIRALCVSLGVVLCVVCWTPNILIPFRYQPLGAGIMFFVVGFGVFLIVYSNSIAKGFDRLLNVNEKSTISGQYAYGSSYNRPVKYKSKTAQTIVEIYWPTVTCIYLIISFLTFSWGSTWIIWVIAGVFHRVVTINCIADEN
ncbi:MAG: hypothetical protein J6X94_09130 [Lachnospiraceae bacterium]|nr:hypothetical protein [Lachnospiraceae bacterium]